MSDNNRNNNQDYLDLLGEYAQREKEEKEKEKIDENFYNQEEELSSIKSEKSKTRVDLSVFDEEKPKKRRIQAPPLVKSDAPREKNPFKRFTKWFKSLSKAKKVIFSIIAVILAIIIALTSAGGIFVLQKLSLIGDAFGNTGEDVIYEDEQFEDIEIDIGV